MLKSTLSAADGRLIEKIERMRVMSRPHGPPRMLRSARPRQSNTSESAQIVAESMVKAYAAPIDPTRRTSTNRYASGTVSATDRIASHIGVRLSPAARIAETAMNQTVWNTLPPPRSARIGAATSTTSSVAPSSRRSGAANTTKPTPKATPAIAPRSSDWRVTSAAVRILPSPIRRLTCAIVPIASERHTGNIRKRNCSDAPTAAVAIAPRWPTNTKTVACPPAAMRFSMIPGQASSSAARCGWSAASSAARRLGAGGCSACSSATSAVKLTARRAPHCRR